MNDNKAICSKYGSDVTVNWERNALKKKIVFGLVKDTQNPRWNDPVADISIGLVSQEAWTKWLIPK